MVYMANTSNSTTRYTIKQIPFIKAKINIEIIEVINGIYDNQQILVLPDTTTIRHRLDTNLPKPIHIIVKIAENNAILYDADVQDEFSVTLKYNEILEQGTLVYIKA